MGRFRSYLYQLIKQRFKTLKHGSKNLKKKLTPSHAYFTAHYVELR